MTCYVLSGTLNPTHSLTHKPKTKNQVGLIVIDTLTLTADWSAERAPGVWRICSKLFAGATG